MHTWRQYSQRLHSLAETLACTDGDGRPLDAEAAFNLWRDWAAALRAAKGTAYLIGNGASASMASHFAADLAKNGRLHTQTFFDLSLITAISNDIGYDQVFSLPLRQRGRPGDMLVAVSSSGGSPNVLAAADAARELPITLVTLTGKRPDNPLRARGNLNFYVADDSYSLVETSHAAVLHWWMDLVEASARA